MRTAIYARYSSELQNKQSIHQQLEACRERAMREGWDVVQEFSDAAISGAAGTNERQRPGIAALLQLVDAGEVQLVLVDTTSRIARIQSDFHSFLDRLAFRNVSLFTLGDGYIDRFKGAIKGLLDEQQRVELRHNIKRGQKGTVQQGRSPAGVAYGYRTANYIDASGRPVRGVREIEPDQARVVRRIFAEYSAGLSPVRIAQRLNADDIPGPRGGFWRATTIRPDRTRGNGLLQNQLYIGRIVHNRTSKVVDPQTRRSIIRANGPEHWNAGEAPHLRIIDQDLWDRVQVGLRRLEAQPLTHTRRARHMLSGLGVCGVCGGPWTVKTATFWGCGSRSEGNNCSNNRTISTESYERRVLTGLTERMLEPELVSAFVEEYRSEYAKRSVGLRREHNQLERKVTEASKKIDRLVAAISAGAGDFIEVRDALNQARADRDGALAALAEVDAVPLVALHPAIAEDYRRQVNDLHVALADSEARIEAVPAVRKLIDRVVLIPNPQGRGVLIEVQGRLAAIVALASGSDAPQPLTATMERVKGIEPSS